MFPQIITDVDLCNFLHDEFVSSIWVLCAVGIVLDQYAPKWNPADKVSVGSQYLFHCFHRVLRSINREFHAVCSKEAYKP